VEIVAKDLIIHYGPLVIGWVLSGYLLYVVFKDKKAPINGNRAVTRYDFDNHMSTTAAHFSLIEGRLADYYQELNEFKVEVARFLATREDLKETELRIKDHITTACKVRQRNG
jgi:hypothetical protein